MNYVVATRTTAFGTVCLSHREVVTVVYSHFSRGIIDTARRATSQAS